MTTALLCETVTGRTMAELVVARDGATHGDMVELRLDGVSDLDVAGALQGRRVPAVVTVPADVGRRPLRRHRGGAGAHSAPRTRGWRGVRGRRMARRAIRTAIHVIVRRDPARIVVSSHDFDGVPSDLDDRVRAMRGAGAGSIKVAVRGLAFERHAGAETTSARGGDAVVIGMGEAGVPSRLLAAHYRIAVDVCGHGVAPGQIPAETMVDDFSSSASVPTTRIFGVVSTNAMHSLSPVMHNAAFEAAGHRRRLRAAAGVRLRRLSGLMPRRWASRAPASRFRSSSTRCVRRRAPIV